MQLKGITRSTDAAHGDICERRGSTQRHYHHVVEDGIDADTVTRMNETLDLKGLKAAQGASVPTSDSETSLLVGIKGSRVRLTVMLRSS